MLPTRCFVVFLLIAVEFITGSRLLPFLWHGSLFLYSLGSIKSISSLKLPFSNKILFLVAVWVNDFLISAVFSGFVADLFDAFATYFLVFSAKYSYFGVNSITLPLPTILHHPLPTLYKPNIRPTSTANMKTPLTFTHVTFHAGPSCFHTYITLHTYTISWYHSLYSFHIIIFETNVWIPCYT